MKRSTRIVAVMAASFVGALALAGPAAATGQHTEPKTGPVCAWWKARGATGVYPAVVFGGKPAGTEISKDSAKLTKPAGVQPGVEFATFNLGLPTFTQETHIRVEYATSGGASTAAGAIRMFAYHSKNADTLHAAPDYQKTAEAESGNLLITVPAGKRIGTLGLVFDASNNTTGAVTFSNMTVGERKVSFTRCPRPEPTKPTPSTSTSTTPKPSGSASTTVSPSASSSSPVAGGGANGGNGLPVTGPSIGIVAGVAAVLLAAGVGLAVASRRRRTRFTA